MGTGRSDAKRAQQKVTNAARVEDWKSVPWRSDWQEPGGTHRTQSELGAIQASLIESLLEGVGPFSHRAINQNFNASNVHSFNGL